MNSADSNLQNRDKEWEKLLAYASQKKNVSTFSVTGSPKSPIKRFQPKESTNIFASLDLNKLMSEKTKEGFYQKNEIVPAIVKKAPKPVKAEDALILACRRKRKIGLDGILEEDRKSPDIYKK